MSRITSTLTALRERKKKALIPFITAGDPQPAMTVPLMHALVQGGVDVIELGVPFSDPMADGPVIQRASERALAHGVTLSQVIGFVEEFRTSNNTTPVVLMGYANPIEAMGYAAFARRAKAAGVDGVLVVDYPPEEARALVDVLDQHQLDTIFLLSPTTRDARLQSVGKLGRGYLYYVSLKGVTGAGHLDVAEVAARVQHIKSFTSLPVGVGFGIRDAESAKSIARVADAVVIGSKLIQLIEATTPALAPSHARHFMAEIRQAIHDYQSGKMGRLAG